MFIHYSNPVNMHGVSRGRCWGSCREFARSAFC